MMAVNINHILNGICGALDSKIDALIQYNIVPKERSLLHGYALTQKLKAE